MSDFRRFVTHHVPDDGTQYVPGETVRIDHSSGTIQIVKDPIGDYEILNCRPATEYRGDTPLIRLGLRKREFACVEHITPWVSRRSSAWWTAH